MQRAFDLAGQEVDYMGIVISGVSASSQDFASLCRFAPQIIATTGIKLCASLGLLSYEQGLRLKEAGFSSYHHNLETSRNFYPQICTSHPYQARIETIVNAKKAGLRVCAGGIFGVGESMRDLLDMALSLRELAVDSVPINFLNPIAGTPLEKRLPLAVNEALAIIALYRLLLPTQDIVIGGGRSITLGDWQPNMFFAGANGLMVGDYLTTRGAGLSADMAMLNMLGLKKNKTAAG